MKPLKIELKKGFSINGISVYTRRTEPGRISGEDMLDIFVRSDDADEHLMYIKIFYGRDDHYRPFVELVGINTDIRLGDKKTYFKSKIEERLLGMISEPLPGGGKLHVPYEGDRETAYGLSSGFPPVLTRLGYLLFKFGYTWFKDWYFPEGGAEGAQKLQGEKPLNTKEKERQLKDLEKEVLEFLKNNDISSFLNGVGSKEEQGYWKRAFQRAEKFNS